MTARPPVADLNAVLAVALEVLDLAQALPPSHPVKALANVTHGLIKRLTSGDLSAYSYSPTVAASAKRLPFNDATEPLKRAAHALQRALETAEGPAAGIARCTQWRERARADVVACVREGGDLNAVFARLATSEVCLDQAYRRRARARKAAQAGAP